MGTIGSQRVALFVAVNEHVGSIVLHVECHPLLLVVAGHQFPAAGAAVAVVVGCHTQCIALDGRGFVEVILEPRIDKSVVTTFTIEVVYLLAVGIGYLRQRCWVIINESIGIACLGSTLDGSVDAVGQVGIVSLRIAKELNISNAKSGGATCFLQGNLEEVVAAVVVCADDMRSIASGVAQLHAAYQSPLLSVGAGVEHQLLEVLQCVIGTDHAESPQHVGAVGMEDNLLCALQLRKLKYGEVVLVEERRDVRVEAYWLEGAVVNDAVV